MTANRNGHIACTNGGECLAGLIQARRLGMIDNGEIAIIDSTAHALKLSGFQDLYFENKFPDEFNISPNNDLINAPVLVRPSDLEKVPSPGNPLAGSELKRFVQRVSEEIAEMLSLQKIDREG